jgi:hypothetical protein
MSRNHHDSNNVRADKLRFGSHLPTTAFCQQTSHKNQRFESSKSSILHSSTMVKQQEKKTLVKSDKLTQGEKKKIKNDNKAKANPEKAAAKKEKNDATRARRYVKPTQPTQALLLTIRPIGLMVLYNLR